MTSYRSRNLEMVSRVGVYTFLFSVGVPLLVIGMCMLTLVIVGSKMRREFRKSAVRSPGEDLNWTPYELHNNKRNVMAAIGVRDLRVDNLKEDINVLKKQRKRVILHPSGGANLVYNKYKDLTRQINQKYKAISSIKKGGIEDILQLDRANAMENKHKYIDNLIQT